MIKYGSEEQKAARKARDSNQTEQQKAAWKDRDSNQTEQQKNARKARDSNQTEEQKAARKARDANRPKRIITEEMQRKRKQTATEKKHRLATQSPSQIDDITSANKLLTL